ncbi:hypothetical protein [Streptomyces sp. Ag109_G2-15]|uniref:hypothetical protein n=1 Tax=Streptomyces sp. Ag109_G2-15 TaxID=1938850 RepID=UPI000BE37D88|nr:hypothetical protein [Streptomyces sp. Ag109_G2-15]
MTPRKLRRRVPDGAPGRTDTRPAVLGVLVLAPTADLAWADELGSGRGAPAGRTVVVHGTLDEALTVAMARRYAARAGVTLHELPGCGHFDVIDPESAAAWSVVTEALRTIVGAAAA